MPKPRKAQRALGDPGAIHQAAAHHQRGQLAEAERLYNGILAAEPNHFDALHLLGVLRQQQGRSVEALKLIAAALKRNAASADALSNYGVVLDALRRHEEAVAAYDQALALKPDQADALSNRGNALNRIGRSEEALASCEAALALNPNHVDALCNRGAALCSLDRHDEALACYDRALAARPGYPEAYFNRGQAFLQLGRYRDALEAFDRTLAARPRHLDALEGRTRALIDFERFEEALRTIDQVLAVEPQRASALNKRGYVLLALFRLHEATAAYQAALRQDPESLEALNGLGNIFSSLERHDEAERFYDRGLAVAPDRAGLKWNKSCLYLSCGRFSEGWGLFDYRLKGGVKITIPQAYPQPRWNGETINGTLLVWGEQGLGDQIIYSSMVPDLFAPDQKRAGSVVLEIEPRLVTLFARSFPAARVVPLGPELYAGDVEAHAPVGGLGEFLRPSFEAFPRREQGYLVADAERAARLRERLTRDKPVVIGLSWRSTAPVIGKAKTVQLRDFESLLRLPNCRFVDLQYGDTRDDRAAIERDLGVRIDRLDDIDNTKDIDGLAALMTACDAVVTVSNTTAHLAGALGRPTWVFLPFGSALLWYWFKRRTDSPWYPHARLWRQADAEPWADLIASGTKEISEFVSPA